MKKQKKYAHLNQTKRDRIQALLDSGHNQKEIASILDVNPSTVCREVKRNRRIKQIKGKNLYDSYQSSLAQRKAYWRRYNAKWRWKKINHDPRIEAYIVEKLKKHWNPDEIAGRMREDHEPFYASKTAIYEWLRTGRGARYCRYLYSGRYAVRVRKDKKTKRVLIPHRVSIHERFLGAMNRTRYGHWEGDTIVSGKHTASKAALSVVYERKARYIDARKILNLKPLSHTAALQSILANKKALSLTQDNGIENQEHTRLGIPTFFCDPYSSWQKPGVENANKMIRRYIPKGADIAEYSDEYVGRMILTLNNKPRKSLRYRTPHEVMVEHHLFIENNTATIALRG